VKRLFILRHAKSSWTDPALTDFERPLNKRGRRAAPVMGTWFAKHNLQPDIVFCSLAARAQETFQLVSESALWDTQVIHTEDLYLAPARTYIEQLAQLPESIDSAMVIGHNPGMEELVYDQCGELHPMPTCALAVIEFNILSWETLLSGAVAGQLEHHILVRDLE
tara:strand:+ start:457 stop:951 length:495 start_codon:yes stop_codon:yes gene_type:complete